ncbi:hypothetical protein PIB30_015891 [Stylosanthes scabra]|uniref:Uncharacterized protein n=1 Tax=Stylosanthes scabra TaxID=79078 RepID=A0ABU6T7F6_9FABA|nr:hypothetical protein [Stylosanthes scabra]
MAEDIFYFAIHINGVIIQRENGASFESNALLMFRHSCVNTMWELKQLILSNLGFEGDQKMDKLAYRFQAVTAENRLEYRPSWLSEDNHVWIIFEVHRKLIQNRFMEFCAEVRHVGGSSGFRPFAETKRSTNEESSGPSMSKSLNIHGPSKSASRTYGRIAGGDATIMLPRRSSSRRGT